MSRMPCYYCQVEDGVERLGIGYSGRCGAHYWRPAFPPDAEAPLVEQFEESLNSLEAPDAEAPPVQNAQDETIEMFPLAPGPARPMF